MQCFKKGPDYIDPMWLTHASGRSCFNLDFNTQTTDEMTGSVDRRSANADLALIEGNKGLYDGVDVEGGDTNAALAKSLGASVVLVIDTVGITRGIAPLVLGYRTFDPGVSIVGVILNKVGPSRQETKLRQALERYTDVPVLGAIPRDDGLALKERHLGLTTPAEEPANELAIARMRQAVEAGIDLDRLLALSGESAKIKPRKGSTPCLKGDTSRIRIAIAHDAAFGFYYPDDLEEFERLGAELHVFNALTAPRLPDVDGLFIGGGFPETQAEKLSANTALRLDIARQLRTGLPAYAECGGMMYLARSLRWRGQTHEMVGVIPADAVMHDRPQGRGLVVLEETQHMPWPKINAVRTPDRIPAHEFHYSSLENLPADARFAYRMLRGTGIRSQCDGLLIGNLLANFSHLRTTAANPWIERFLTFVRAKKLATYERRCEPHIAYVSI